MLDNSQEPETAPKADALSAPVTAKAPVKSPRSAPSTVLRGVLASGAVALFIGSIWSYLAVAGLIHMPTARVILLIAWSVGVGGIIMSEFIWARSSKHKIAIGTVAALVLASALYLLDAWTVRHLPQPPMTIADTPRLAQEVAKLLGEKINIRPSTAAEIAQELNRITTKSPAIGIADDLRANIHIQGVRLFPSEVGPFSSEHSTLGSINAIFFMKNIGRSAALKNAIIWMKVDLSKPMDDTEETKLFHGGFGARGMFTGNNEISPGDERTYNYRMSNIVGPSEWKQMKEGTYLIYVMAWASFSDKYGRRVSEFCRAYKWPELQEAQNCNDHNRVFEVRN